MARRSRSAWDNFDDPVEVARRAKVYETNDGFLLKRGDYVQFEDGRIVSRALADSLHVKLPDEPVANTRAKR